MRNLRGAICALFCLFSASGALAQTIRIVAIGDSNFDVPGNSSFDMYPAQLERALRARGYDVAVVNSGLRGDTSMGVLSRLDRDVPNTTDVALVSVGINDVILHGVSKEQAKQNVKQIMGRLKARGVFPVWLLTGKEFQRSVKEDPNYHVEKVQQPGTTKWHLNAAGNAVVVRQTLPQVIAAIEKVKKSKKKAA